jgi:integrase
MLRSPFLQLAEMPGLLTSHFTICGTFGTRLADAGVDVVKIKELMGHASIVTTMRYMHATDQGKRGAIVVLSEYRQKRRHKFVTTEKRQTLEPAVSR